MCVNNNIFHCDESQGRWQLTLFLEHLNLHVFYCRIFGVVHRVVVSTVVILIAETARIKHVLS